MKVLGIDSSTTSTGYAVVDNDKLICYGSIKPNKKKDTISKIIEIEKELKDIIVKKEVEYIVIEDLAVTRNAGVTKMLAGLLYHLLIEFRKKEMLVITCRPSEWRSCCKIKGKERKELKENTINYVKNKYNIKVNDDEADSICIAEYGNSLGVE